MNWTNPQMETLSRLWTEGMTANQIAGVLGEGVTRNAVIGKLHRLGLTVSDKQGAPSEAPAASPPAQDVVKQASPSVVEVEPPVDDQAILIQSKPKTAVTIAELTEGMCRWPAEEQAGEGFRYCGEPTEGATPYCAGHCKLAYQPSKPIRRKPDRNMMFSGIVIEAPK